MNSFVLFNNKGGVGKTTLTFNIGSMMARQGLRTVLLDYDPQCNVSAMALSDAQLEDIWQDETTNKGTTAYRCIDLVRRGKGDILRPELIQTAPGLWILPGELSLSRFEQGLAEGWAQFQGTDNERALHVTTSLARLAEAAAAEVSADLVILDVGPNLGALNRAALLAADAIIVPVAPDLFSLQGLRNVGPTVRAWRKDWKVVAQRGEGTLIAHDFQPRGYIVQQHLARADRIVKGYEEWRKQIPVVFHAAVLDEPTEFTNGADDDPYCLAMLKHFSSLVPLAQTVRKPIFDLKQADGIGGGQIQAVVKARREFELLVTRLRDLLGLPSATPSTQGPQLALPSV
jgi:chromosome partitioning protein